MTIGSVTAPVGTMPMLRRGGGTRNELAGAITSIATRSSANSDGAPVDHCRSKNWASVMPYGVMTRRRASSTAS